MMRIPIFSKFYIANDYFEFNATGNKWMQWIQKRMMLWLAKQKAISYHPMYEDQCVRTITIDKQRLAASIIQCAKTLGVNQNQVKQVYVGPDIIYGLMADSLIHTYGRPIDLSSHGFDFYGMKVTVIPWMTGILLVP